MLKKESKSCLINYRSVIIVVVMVTGYSTKIYSVYCSLVPRLNLSIFFIFLYVCFCAVFAALFAEGLLSSTSDSIVNLAIGGFGCDIRHHIIGVCSSPFACRPATASVAAILW